MAIALHGRATAPRPERCRSSRPCTPIERPRIVAVDGGGGSGKRRGIARDIGWGVNGDQAQGTAFWHTWLAAELAFFDLERPWERACVVVNGTLGPLPPDCVEIAPGRPPADIPRCEQFDRP